MTLDDALTLWASAIGAGMVAGVFLVVVTLVYGRARGG